MSRYELVASENISILFKRKNSDTTELMTTIGVLVSMLAIVNKEQGGMSKEKFMSMITAYVNTIWEKVLKDD